MVRFSESVFTGLGGRKRGREVWCTWRGVWGSKGKWVEGRDKGQELVEEQIVGVNKGIGGRAWRKGEV